MTTSEARRVRGLKPQSILAPLGMGSKLSTECRGDRVKASAGSRRTLDKTQALTWTGGWDLKPLIGVSLNAKTGYTTTAKLVFNIGKKNKQWCCQFGWPSTKSGNVKIR